ncbi:hypothetical protein KPH14_007206 [Odynerus spinipes]|uniref:Uncharacterized protein n=1 Tax=Odynerus spinipes TaxID=1348599 RepID=A0AAD9RAJ5_9HYME|nr:hypothetical protein KPH14_007206 [Odynerus spinipes]
MSTDDSTQKHPRYEKLAKPKLKIDRTSNVNPYKITDSLNKLAQPKRRTDLNLYDLPSSSTRTAVTSNEERPVRQRLINSSEESRNIVDLGKKKNLLDSYARITASRNRRCPKRLRELARPSNKRTSIGNEETYGNFGKNFYQNTKSYPPRANATFGSQSRR